VRGLLDALAGEDDEHPTSERRMEEAERRARAKSEEGDVEPWSAQP
jgi:predicted Zn-dependent protease